LSTHTALRLLFLGVAVCLQACSTPAPPPAPGARIGQPDMLCVNDCLGTGGSRPFCQERCTD